MRIGQTSHCRRSFAIQRHISKILLAVCFLSLLERSVSPQTLAEPGRSEFLSNCAVCHGFDGKGAGRAAPQLKSAPADLTKLAKANHGIFSPEAVHKMIDGRDTSPNHRSIEMPIWGCRHDTRPISPRRSHRRKAQSLFQRKARPPTLESLLDLPCDPETVVQARIQSIVDYLSRIQEK